MAKKKSKPNSKARLAAAGNLEPYQTYLQPDKLDELRALSKRTRIKATEYMREALDDLLRKYKAGGK